MGEKLCSEIGEVWISASGSKSPVLTKAELLPQNADQAGPAQTDVPLWSFPTDLFLVHKLPGCGD